MNPKYPLYIVSKGRADSRYTARVLERLNVPYRIIVEQSERDEYARVIDPDKVLVLPVNYQPEYEVCDELGLTKSTGPGPARNFAWDHAISEGHDWHWVMDDNIRGFFRYNRNALIPVADGTIFRAMETFCERYTNIAMAGPQYFMFIARKMRKPAFVANTRIYSCNLIRNDTPYRWRGRYNEDTDLSLRMLKDGWCTVQFNAFIQDKITTQVLKGGNTAAFYAAEGTHPKSDMLVKLHPDVARHAFRFGRDHHYVDYSPFANNRLIRKPDVELVEGVDNMGMVLQTKAHGRWVTVKR